MYPPLADMYAVTLKLEREEELLRLYKEARILRRANKAIFSRPKVNLKRLLAIFNRERVGQGEAAPVSLHPAIDCCITSKTVQCQLC